MAKKTAHNWQQDITVAVTAIAVLILGLWYWYDQVYMKPANVFWGTMAQDLQTGGVTKTSYQTSGDQSMQQVTNLHFKGQLVAHTIVTISNKSTSYSGGVVTETYGTTLQDFLRYQEKESTASSIPKDAINIWASSTNSSNQPGQFLSDALLTSPMIFGYLDSQQVSDIILQMHDHNAFSINFGSTGTTEHFDGKRVYVYKIIINVASYLQVLRSYLAMIGQQDLALQIGQSAAGTTYGATLLINPLSRQPLEFTENGSTVSETYSNFDVNDQLQPPKASKITIWQLQQRLEEQLQA